MSTKTQIETSITTNLATGSDILASEVRETLELVVDNLYPTAVTDNNTTETYTTKSGTNITYSITLFKQGNLPAIKGTITNSTFGTLASQNVFTWKDNEYKPKSGYTYLFDAVQGSTKVRCFINNNVLAITSPMPTGTFSIDNFQLYIAQD